MSDSTVRIGLVLPDVMGTYGDGGNAIVLRQRLRLRGYDAEVINISLTDPVPHSLDIYTLGGAEDNAQRLAVKRLSESPGLQQAAEQGTPILAICAAIQVLGHWYRTSTGETIAGLSMLDLTSAPQKKRAIGELITKPLLDGLPETLLTGFENHRGATTLGDSAKPLGQTQVGVGNGTPDNVEGVVQGSTIGTYMHGPVLARNPALADYLLQQALGVNTLAPLDIEEVTQLRKERLRIMKRS